MIHIRLDKVTFAYPAKPIFREASCEVQAGCYGVIGANGSGKTTLLKLIANELQPDAGVILRDKKLNIAYLPQEIEVNSDLDAFETVRKGAKRILALEAELAQLENKFADPGYYTNEKSLANLIDKQQETLTTFHQCGGHGLEGEIKALLTAIGFKAHEMTLPVKYLSGGQKKLLGLASILIDRPDILLLDEPDNHLDLRGKAMLEQLISNFSGTVLIVSHDRYFLDMVVDHLIEVEGGVITQFEGNYSEFVFEKELKLQRQAALFQVQQKEITRLKQAAKRLLMWGQVYDNVKFSNRGKNILKRLDRLEVIDKPLLEREQIRINLEGWRGSAKVLEINQLAKGFPTPDGKSFVPVLENIVLLLRYGDRVGMIGPNGVGKSLLIRLILQELEPDSGTIYRGPSVKMGYYAQEFETLNPKMTLLETICKAGNLSENRGIALLKKYLFTFEQRNTPVGALSGGERARLQIALITLSGANFLLLDEPTNHLDIPSCEVLEEALLDFEGTILAISHDRYFLDRLADRIVELHGIGSDQYVGNYSEYENQRRMKKTVG